MSTIDNTSSTTYMQFDGRVPVAANRALQALYAWGGILIGIGLVIIVLTAVTTSAAESSLSQAYGFGVIGGGLISIGVTTVLAGAVAHAINYQIRRSLTGHANFLKH